MLEVVAAVAAQHLQRLLLVELEVVELAAENQMHRLRLLAPLILAVEAVAVAAILVLVLLAAAASSSSKLINKDLWKLKSTDFSA